MAETPTREQLSVWLEAAQAQRVEMQVLLAGAEEAQTQLATDNERLREALAGRRCCIVATVEEAKPPLCCGEPDLAGCCKVDGGEDANASD